MSWTLRITALLCLTLTIPLGARGAEGPEGPKSCESSLRPEISNHEKFLPWRELFDAPSVKLIQTVDPRQLKIFTDRFKVFVVVHQMDENQIVNVEIGEIDQRDKLGISLMLGATVFPFTFLELAGDPLGTKGSLALSFLASAAVAGATYLALQFANPSILEAARLIQKSEKFTLVGRPTFFVVKEEDFKILGEAFVRRGYESYSAPEVLAALNGEEPSD